MYYVFPFRDAINMHEETLNKTHRSKKILKRIKILLLRIVVVWNQAEKKLNYSRFSVDEYSEYFLFPLLGFEQQQKENEFMTKL